MSSSSGKFATNHIPSSTFSFRFDIYSRQITSKSSHDSEPGATNNFNVHRANINGAERIFYSSENLCKAYFASFLFVFLYENSSKKRDKIKIKKISIRSIKILYVVLTFSWSILLHSLFCVCVCMMVDPFPLFTRRNVNAIKLRKKLFSSSGIIFICRSFSVFFFFCVCIKNLTLEQCK